MDRPQAAVAYCLDHIQEAIITFDREWRYTYVNRAAAELSGKSPAELLGNKLQEVFPSIVDRLCFAELHQAAAEGRHRHFEEHFAAMDRWLEADAYPTDDGIIMILRDVTESRKQTLEVQRRFGQLQLLFELAGAVSRAQELDEIYRIAIEGLVRTGAADRAAILIYDPDGVMRFKAWIGLSEEYRTAVEGHTPWARGAFDAQPITVSDVMRESSLAPCLEAMAKERIRAVAFIPLIGNGGLIGKFMLYVDTPYDFRPEETQVAQTIATHVAAAAERKGVETALRASEERFRTTFLQAAIGIAQTSPTGEWLLLNEHFCGMLGYTQGELRGKTFLEVTHPDDRESSQAFLQLLLAGEVSAGALEKRYIRKDGNIVWAKLFVSLARDEENRPRHFITVVEDISDRVQAENALHESEERFRNMADTAPVMIWVSDDNKQIIFFNKTWLTFTGRTLEQELGSGWAEGIHPDDLNGCYSSFCSAFDARRSFGIEYRLRRADGEYRWMLCSGVPRFAPGGVFAGYIGSDIDITDLRRAQEEVFARQKWESLGVLTGGIAHDFNNLLGGILAEAELAETYLTTGTSPAEEIQVIKAIAIRAAEIVRELMIFSGQDKAVLEPVDVSRLVEEMLELLKVSISKHAILQTNLLPNLPPIRGNAAQIRQILMNLVINASEAIGEKPGVISVMTSCVRGGEDAAPYDLGKLPEGYYLRLEVSDTGCGMTDEERARIFDPFFTTKFAGRGLGLAVVQGIVKAHEGTITLASVPGKGTSFRIHFPCAGMPAAAEQNAPLPNTAAPLPGTAGTVLMVEDEETLRMSVSKMLRRAGFSVIEAADGSTAIDLFRSYKDDVDVVLLDMTIPGASSQEVMLQARRIRPGIKIILTTAYSREMVALSPDGPQIDGFIRKPFQVGEVVRLLRDTLSSKSNVSSA
jgi:two-component system cell cycle sensor histidine kinase/response regulator CckA